MSRNKVATELGRLYQEWARKARIVRDRSKPLFERAAALRWIDRQTGEERPESEYTLDGVEQVAREIDELGV